MRKALLAVLFVGCSLAPLPPAAAEPWARLRGPNGTGTTRDTDVPVKWTEQDVLWKAPLPGVGHSSPVVWGDHVFVQSATADGKERLLVCLSAADGKVRWTQSVPGSLASKHQFNSLASSTPATDGERVYALFWDGRALTLNSYDFKGTPVWSRPLGELHIDHGAGASPVVYGNKVFLANEQDQYNRLMAFEAKTGKPLWEVSRRPFRASFASPFVLERPGMPPELVVASTAGVGGYDLETGAENWRWDWTFDAKPLRAVGSPVAGQGLIIAATGDGGGQRHTVALKPGSKDDQPAVVWEKKAVVPYVPTNLVRGEHLYFVNDAGMAGCCVIKSGKIVWTERLGGTVMASPVLIGDKVYAVNEAGDVFVFAAAPAFKLLAKNSLGEPVRASPAVADGRFYVRGKEHLFCVGRGTR